jgi:hypothetical protein
MTMYMSPGQAAAFSANTKADTFLDVKKHEFWCLAGKHNVSNPAGRKRHLSGRGWTCAACVEKRKSNG